MSSDVKLSVRGVSKCYCIYSRPRDRVMQALSGAGRKLYREVWALRRVGFELRRGETVGVVGRNGSGKSTLLQIVTGVLEPTEGTVQASGPMSAVLELGAGFNPEFTGRENVYMGATIAGLSRREIDDRYAAIVDFAELAPYMDQPVKTYSTGMYVRLAFAIQVMVPKEVLVVDEALAVGDEAFQRKCYGKLEEFKLSGGTTMFVSHSVGAVVDLCDRALLLDGGELLLDGPADDVVKEYQRLIYAPPSSYEDVRREIASGGAAGAGGATRLGAGEETRQLQSHFRSDASKEADKSAFLDESAQTPRSLRYVSRGARIVARPRLTDEGGRPVNLLRRGGRYFWSYVVAFERDATNVRFGMLIRTVTGVELGGAAAPSPEAGFSVVSRGTLVKVRFAFRARLAPATYFLNAGVLGSVAGEEGYLDRWVDVSSFRVLADGASPLTGLVDLQIDFDVSSPEEKLESTSAPLARVESSASEC